MFPDVIDIYIRGVCVCVQALAHMCMPVQEYQLKVRTCSHLPQQGHQIPDSILLGMLKKHLYFNYQCYDLIHIRSYPHGALVLASIQKRAFSLFYFFVTLDTSANHVTSAKMVRHLLVSQLYTYICHFLWVVNFMTST